VFMIHMTPPQIALFKLSEVFICLECIKEMCRKYPDFVTVF
jgi:hypothetical protein